MAQFTSAAILVEVDVFEVAQVASGLGNLEFLLVGLVLVAGRAVDLLALNLILFFQMRLVNEGDLFCELDFFGLESVVGFAVAGSSHTIVITDPRPRPDSFAA